MIWKSAILHLSLDLPVQKLKEEGKMVHKGKQASINFLNRALALKALDMRLSKGPASNSTSAEPALGSKPDAVLFDAEENTPSSSAAPDDLDSKK